MTYGLTTTGFVTKPQSVIITEIQTALQAALGQNINLLPRAVYGQLTGIFSEREALLWQLLEAVYASQYPAGAEGASVDNILSLNNLRRLAPAATQTAPTSTAGIPGLLFLGDVGTTIPAGSIISVNGRPDIQFTTDADYTIGAAVSAVQQITFVGGIPTTGAFTLSIVDPAGNLLTTSPINWNDSTSTVETKIRALSDIGAGNQPFTDVVVTGAISSGLLTITFGATTPSGSNPPSGDQVQATFTVPSSTLQDGSVVVNVNPETTVAGHPAQVIGAATCTVTGPTFVAATQLNVIGSPISGWNSVSNPLDCITGRDLETDTAALARRAANLNENANGPVTAIAEKVGLVTGVVQARGFQNVSGAAEQKLGFTGVPTAGYFTLALSSLGFPVTTGHIPFNAQANLQTVSFTGTPTAGYFTLTLGVQTTAHIPFSATAAGVQAALRALPGYENITVTGSFALGFTVSFGIGTQLPLVAVNALTGVSAIAVVPSVQSMINAVPGYEPATVLGSFAAGFVVAFVGSSGGQPQALMTAVNALTGVSAIAVTFGRPPKSFEIVVNDNNGEAQDADIAATIFGAAPAGIESYGNVSVAVDDGFGNTQDVEFSRPTQVPIYVRIDLVTDLSTSKNPSFNTASIPTIQQDIVTIGRAFDVGGLIVGRGTGGLVGAFNDVPGITSYTLTFGPTLTPTTDDNIQLQPTQVGLFETFNVIVSYV